MTLDKDNEVAVQTMKLLVLISKWVNSLFVSNSSLMFFLWFFCDFKTNYFWLLRTSDDVLSPEDYKQLLQFVYSSQRPLAATAGELLFSRCADLRHFQKRHKQTSVSHQCVWILSVSHRLLNTAAPASDTQDEMNDEEKEKQQTFARLKALLQFYRESEVRTNCLLLMLDSWCLTNTLCLSYTFSCTSMWCT